MEKVQKQAERIQDATTEPLNKKITYMVDGRRFVVTPVFRDGGESFSQAVTADMFISTVRKYTRAKKLTPRMLNELIQYIEVHQAEKVDGVWEQKLTIHYNCVGVIDIPTELSLPYPEVSVNTRKGVTVCYVPNTFVVKEAGA